MRNRSCSAVKITVRSRPVRCRTVRRRSRSRAGVEQRQRDVDDLRPQELAEALGLRIGAGGRGHAPPEQAPDDEVERPAGWAARSGRRRARRSRRAAAPAAGRPRGTTASSRRRPRPGAQTPTLALPPLSPGTGTDEPAERDRRHGEVVPVGLVVGPGVQAALGEVVEQRRDGLGVVRDQGRGLGPVGGLDGRPVGHPAGQRRRFGRRRGDGDALVADHDDVLGERRRHERRPVDAVARRARRRAGGEEAGVAGQHHLDDRVRERPTHLRLVGVHDGDAQLGEGVVVGDRIEPVGATQARRRPTRTTRGRRGSSTTASARRSRPCARCRGR